MPELIGLLVGLVAGVLFPWAIPSQYSLYVAAGLLAALDSALGGFRARIKGEFKLDVFLSGTVGNTAIAAFLTWLGQKLGIPLGEMPVHIVNHRESKIHVVSDALRMLRDIRRIKKHVREI